jgi:predicted DNA-binding protein (MmcQ/YjbR family)
MRGIIPAPYLARAQWVHLDRLDRLPDKQLKGYTTRAHAIVARRLTRKARAALGIAESGNES